MATMHSNFRPPVRSLIIGAGSRGLTYARAIDKATDAIVLAIAEPIAFKRRTLGKNHVWKENEPRPEQEFEDWRDFLEYEKLRRKREAAGETVEEGVNTVFVCVLDPQHAETIIALAPLNLHIMSEKPLATTLTDCLSIYAALLPEGSKAKARAVFSIGHVLRYSPHNILLRSLLLEERVIGDVVSIEHTEPESTTAPSLLTKSCHDIDLLLWLLCSPHDPSEAAHLPASISSTGHVSQFRSTRKPAGAGTATNCLSCPIEQDCAFSAKRIYKTMHLDKGNMGWPGKIVHPEIEDCMRSRGQEAATTMLFEKLKEDYDASTMASEDIDSRPWFGRCVWESSNDVCDDQLVTMTWEDQDTASALPHQDGDASRPKFNCFAKTAVFHQIAQTEAQCQRRGRVYGTNGEISYDSREIRVFEFATHTSKIHHPAQAGVKHGGGDEALVRQFILAVQAVESGEKTVIEAQRDYIGCSLEDVIRSHAAVFAAEEARRTKTVIDWPTWWAKNVEGPLVDATRDE